MPRPVTQRTQPFLHQAVHASILRRLLLLALALVLFAVAPLHAQGRAAVKKISPAYPPIAKQLGITGTVVVIATVDASGKVVKAESTSGNKLLATAAIEAVKQWRFATGDVTETFPVSINFEKQ